MRGNGCFLCVSASPRDMVFALWLRPEVALCPLLVRTMPRLCGEWGPKRACFLSICLHISLCWFGPALFVPASFCPVSAVFHRAQTRTNPGGRLRNMDKIRSFVQFSFFPLGILSGKTRMIIVLLKCTLKPLMGAALFCSEGNAGG
jgi:hypothetical protein